MYQLIKRLFDIISSMLLILVLSWLFLLLTIINTFVTKGTPYYTDVRVGKNLKTLKLIKFRSMYKDANTKPEKYFSANELEQWKTERKVENDPRITKFGRFLRKTSLDELPQLFNIFAGSMSVVGPRPVTKTELEQHYTSDQIALLTSVRPGLISNWGVHGRNNVGYDCGERQKLELEYFNKKSLRTDFKLILKAFVVVISTDGAK